MCNDFSGYVTQSYQVVWKRGVSSHDKLYTLFEKQYPELRGSRCAKFEITPDKGYLHPRANWTFQVDEETPSWWTNGHEKEAWKAHRLWKKEVYSLINLKEARNPINPLSHKHKPTKKDIQLLKDWASVGASVGASIWETVGASVGVSIWDSVGASVWDSIWTSVGDSIRTSVWDSIKASVWDSSRASVGISVGAYFGSLFDVWDNQYKYQPAVDLWRRGFVPSFDGKTWRLHSGQKAEIVYEWRPE